MPHGQGQDFADRPPLRVVFQNISRGNSDAPAPFPGRKETRMKLKIPLIVSSLFLLLSGLAPAADKDGKRFMIRLGGGRLGVEAIQLSKEVRQMLGAPEDAGVLVNRVDSDSAAAEAGVKAGDVIVEGEGQKVKDVSTIRTALADKEAGQTA